MTIVLLYIQVYINLYILNMCIIIIEIRKSNQKCNVYKLLFFLICNIATIIVLDNNQL